MAKKVGKKPARKGRPTGAIVLPVRLRGFGPVRFAREALGELRRSHWPTREETIRLTAIVLGVCLVLALFLGLFDFGLASLSKWVFG